MTEQESGGGAAQLQAGMAQMSTMMRGFGKDMKGFGRLTKQKFKGLQEKMSHVDIGAMGKTMDMGLVPKNVMRRHDSVESERCVL